jgi:nicotinamidase-related amidase
MKTALLVIDYINGIINGSCKDYAEKHPIVKNINKVIAFCRSRNIPIYHVRVAFDKLYTDLPKHSPLFNQAKQKGLFQIGNRDAEFIEAIDIQPSDTIINKTAVSPFHSEGLLDSLKSSYIEKLIFTGVATDNAINLGTREAHDMGFYTVVVEDACGASSEEHHQWAIVLLKKIANEIITTDACINR